MDEITTFLTAIAGDSAKQRERAIKNLSPLLLQNSQVIDALQKSVSTDPVEYVRDAARAQLIAAGQVPAASAVPIALKEEGAGKPAVLAIGCMAIPVAVVLCAVVVIAVLAILGPQIGNIFSRVTNGLAGGTP